MIDTPLHAAARMLRRLAASATHHDDARHLLATAGDAVELATGLAPEEAIRVLDEVEAEPIPPPAERCPVCKWPLDDAHPDGCANEPTH